MVANPGGLLPGLDMAHLEGKHKARNPLLADWLRALGYVERFGIGITRMREAMAQAGLPAPALRSAPDWFEVTLPGPGQSFMMAETTQESTYPPNAISPPPAEAKPPASRPWYRQRWSAKRDPI